MTFYGIPFRIVRFDLRGARPNTEIFFTVECRYNAIQYYVDWKRTW